MERDTRLQSICIPLENLIRIPLNKKAQRSEPPCSPKAGSLWKQTHISEPCLTNLSGSPVKEPYLKVPFMNSLAERCPVPRALHSSLKFPLIWAPLQIPCSPWFQKGWKLRLNESQTSSCMIYLTAIGLPPGGSSTVHIYTQTVHRTTQST